MSTESFFIVIEGIDGAGKTSIAQRLRNVLEQTHGDEVLLTQEPHADCLVGAEIRAALAGDQTMSPQSLALAFALNRNDHLERIIEPFLQPAGRIVICDRYVLSSLVYQARGTISMEAVCRLNSWARPPNLTIVLTVSPMKAYERMRLRERKRDLFENNLPARAEKYRAAVTLLRGEGQQIVEVEADGEYTQVFAAVLDALNQHKPSWIRLQPPLLL
ncbi:MAG: dTMP kinase [Chloroflexi bacterium]|nr:dTMP kinase [Chloroflexota bacterium]MCY4248023.1 dTMP kinase [Chloroflexota bacterium]